MKNNKIVLKYMFALSFILVIMFLLRVYYDIKHYDGMLETQKKILTNNILSLFQNSEKNLIDKYRILNTHFINSNLIAHYFKNKQREKLYKLLKKDYEDIKEIARVSDHIVFNSPNQLKKFRNIVKTITYDNGVEFSDGEKMMKSVLTKGSRFDVYYAHPYSSFERGTNENHNGIIRRFILEYPRTNFNGDHC